MSVLVTGGAGYIGSHMVWELLDHGEEVVVLDNLTTGFRWAVPDGVTFVEGDIADDKLVEALLKREKIDTIIHFAGSVVVPESIADPLKYYDNNTSKSRSLLQSAVNCGVNKFIFSSTAAVYGPPEKPEPIYENAVLTPMSPYGASKLMTEMMIRDTANSHDLRYVMLRYFNVAGVVILQAVLAFQHKAPRILSNWHVKLHLVAVILWKFTGWIMIRPMAAVCAISSMFLISLTRIIML